MPSNSNEIVAVERSSALNIPYPTASTSVISAKLSTV